MNLEYFQKLMDLNRKGLLSDEDLAEGLKLSKVITTKKEETPEEEWKRKHEELAEKNRKAAEELREKIKAREEQREKEAILAQRQDEIETKVIEEIDFLSKLTNSIGERVYSDSDLDSMSYYELIALAERVRNAQATVAEDRKEAIKGFTKEDEVKSTPVVEKVPATIDDVKKASEEHSNELDRMMDDYDKVLGESSAEEKDENIVQEEKKESEVVEEAIPTPEEIEKFAQPEAPRKPTLISRAKNFLQSKIDLKNKEIWKSVGKAIVIIGVIAGGLAAGMTFAPGIMVGAAGFAGYNQIKKGMGK